MQNPDLIPDPENQRTPDAAFVSSASHTFRGLPLHPCDIHRQFAAQALGNQLLSGRAKLRPTGAYDGMFMDIAVVLYLCSVEKAAVLAAISDPEAGRAAALDWAAENGIGVGSDDFVEAGALFGQIMKEVQENQFRVEEREGGGSPKK